MKTKLILAAILMFSMSYTAEAQFFKKLKKKAQEAAERTILKKTEEVVTKKTEQAIDSATMSNPNKKSSNKSKKQTQNTFNNNLSSVPETYNFSYKCLMKIKTRKNEIETTYWLEPNKKYFANQMNNDNQKNISVIDMQNKLMVLFSDNGQQKTIMNLPMKGGMLNKYTKNLEKGINSKNNDVKIASIPSKTILGYFCKGYQVTTKEGVTNIWITNKTPIGFLGSMFNTNNVANNILPINENTMLMEMELIPKKKKDAVNMICTSFNKEALTIYKNEYTPHSFSKQ